MKWYVYLICFVFVCLGIFFGISLYREVRAESYVNGSINISNKFSQESFYYASNNVTFYHDIYDESDTYIYQVDLAKVVDVNGVEKMYKLIFNDYVLMNGVMDYGSMLHIVNIDFLDTVGNVLLSGILAIKIEFLSDHTSLKLYCHGLQHASFFEQYFADNGLRLQMLEILEE